MDKLLELLGKRAVATTAGVVGAGVYFGFIKDMLDSMLAIEGLDPSVRALITFLIGALGLGGYLFFISGRNPDGKPADLAFDLAAKKSVVGK